MPLADLLNHSRPRQTSWGYDEDRAAFVVTALAPISTGGEVFDSYGKKCNSRFLLNYGFCVARNVDEVSGQDLNEVRLVLPQPSLCGGPRRQQHGVDGGGVAMDEVLLAAKLSVAGPGPREVRVSTFYGADSTAEAFSLLRFAHARGSEELAALPAGLRSRLLVPLLLHPPMGVDGLAVVGAATCSSEAAPFKWSTAGVGPLSSRNELEVLASLARLCAAQLSAYPTTLAQDEEELARGEEGGSATCSRRRRDALILLSGEKAICRFYVDLQRAVVARLGNGLEEQGGARIANADDAAIRSERSVHFLLTNRAAMRYWQAVWGDQEGGAGLSIAPAASE